MVVVCCCVLLRVVACCCELLRVVARCCVLLCVVVCCCVLLCVVVCCCVLLCVVVVCCCVLLLLCCCCVLLLCTVVCCCLRLLSVVLCLFFVLFSMCYESEASWLKKKQATVTSASPTDCATSTAKMPGVVNLSLCSQRQLPYSDKQGNEKGQSNTAILPSHLPRNSSCELPTAIPPHPPKKSHGNKSRSTSSVRVTAGEVTGTCARLACTFTNITQRMLKYMVSARDSLCSVVLVGSLRDFWTLLVSESLSSLAMNWRIVNLLGF